MNLIDRFTRDSVSRMIWGSCLVVAIGLLALAVVGGRRAVDEERAASEVRASGYAIAIVLPSIAEASLDAPVGNGPLERLEFAVDRGVLVDGRVTAVRLWASDGRLLYSTDDTYPLDSNEALNDPQLRRALGDAAPVTVSERSSAEDLNGGSELITYVPVASNAGAQAVVEVVQDFDETVGAVENDWFVLQLLAGGFALVFLVLMILSFREPLAKVGTGVTFAASGVPPGYALIEEERLRAVNEVYALAQERVDRLKERLREAEHARMATEGELQRVLSRFESPKRPARVQSPPPVLAPAEPEPAVAEPLSVIASEPAEVLTAPEKFDEPEPVPADEDEPVVVAEDAVEEPAAADLSVETEFVEEVSNAAREEAALADEVEPIVIPEPEPEAVTPAADVAASAIPELIEVDEDDDDDAAIARELLLRLMETEVPMADTGVDPGEVRAKLARTAARKKPGGGERRLVDEDPLHRTPPWARNR